MTDATNPESVPVAILDRRHATFDEEQTRDLEQLAGNEKFRSERFLRQRGAETATVLAERRARAFNVPRLGHLTETLSSAVFHREPRIKVDGAPEGDSAWQRLVGTDDGGTADLNATLRDALERALLHGEAAVWVDFARWPSDSTAMSVADADARGLRAPAVIALAPGELRDFNADARGRLLWATVAHSATLRPLPLSAAVEHERRWTVLFPDRWAVYVHRRTEAQQAPGHAIEAKLEASGPHKFGRVPIARLALPPRLELGPLLLSLAKQLVELDNAISWQQLMSLYAMPVVKTTKDFKQVMGEGYAIVLEPGDSFEWAEPAGNALELSLRHRDSLREEFYRCAHGLALGFGADATTAGRSGESKKQDWRATEHALAHLGALVRDLALDIVALVAAGRGETVRATVTGLDSFDLGATAARLEEHVLADTMIRSQRWRVERGRSLVRRLAPELTEQALKEIDAELAEDDAGFDPAKFDEGDA